MSFIQRRGVGDALRALFTWKRIDDQMSRTNQPLIHGGGGLDGDEVVHEGLINATAKFAQGGGQHKVGLRRVDAIRSQTTSIHDGEVSAKAVADIVI